MCSLLAVYHMVHSIHAQRNFIYARNETMPFHAPVLSEPTNAQHYVQISDTDSHPNWTLNVEITD